MERYRQYFEIIRKMFVDTYESAGGSEFRFFHSVNVANIALTIAEKLKISEENTDVVIISAIFHDVAKYSRIQQGGFLDASQSYERENGLENHEKDSAILVGQFLSGILSKEKIAAIQKTITNHNNPETLTEKILHDADELSEMGSMNIWKISTYSAYKKRNIADTIKYWFEIDRARHLDKTEGLFLDESREEARQRISLVDLVFKNLESQLKV